MARFAPKGFVDSKGSSLVVEESEVLNGDRTCVIAFPERVGNTGIFGGLFVAPLLAAKASVAAKEQPFTQ